MSAIAVLQRGVGAAAFHLNGSEPSDRDRHPPPVGSREPTCFVVRVEGELDAAVLPEFSAALERAVAASFRAVVVDLRLTRFLSIGSASALASAKELAALAGVDLRVVACRREVERVLEVTGLRPLFQYYSSVQDALEA
ncbi:hypothetical protein Ntsu_46950 [Nocardia sp. IFM 10818]